MRLRKGLQALALVALLSGTTSVALADDPPSDSRQRQRQRQEQRQSAIPGIIDEFPGQEAESDESSSQSSSGSGTNDQSQSQEQEQSQSQCMICP